MAKRIRKRKCRHCQRFFPPDSRNAWHQHYCSEPECRKASKAASQKQWLDKKENRDQFRCADNVRRVQEWRKAHPGYWRKTAAKSKTPLQDVSTDKDQAKQAVMDDFEKFALQDLLIVQPAVLVGLIAHLTGTALQEDIVLTARRLQQLGDDILNHPIPCKGASDDHKTPHLSTASPSHPQTVQLDRSPAGP